MDAEQNNNECKKINPTVPINSAVPPGPHFPSWRTPPNGQFKPFETEEWYLLWLRLARREGNS